MLLISAGWFVASTAQHPSRPRLTPSYKPSCLLSPQSMLSSRNPVLLRQMLTNFDALFSTTNALIAFVCMGASFRFDERAAALLLISFPYFVLGCALGDATMVDMDFKLRPFGLGFSVLVFTSGNASYLPDHYSTTLLTHPPSSPRRPNTASSSDRQ